MNQIEQQDKNVISRPTTKGERLITIAIMIAGVVLSQVLLWGMIFEYTFSWKFFLISLVVGPSALGWGFANYRTSKFWDSYYGKRLKGQSVK